MTDTQMTTASTESLKCVHCGHVGHVNTFDALGADAGNVFCPVCGNEGAYQRNEEHPAIGDALVNLPEVITPQDIRQRVEIAIAEIEPETELDQVCQAIALLDGIHRWVTDQRKILYQRLDPFIRQRGPFMLGPDRFFIGHKSETKCKDMPAAVRAIYVRCEKVNPETGEVLIDLGELIDCLSVNAIKQSVARKILPPEEFAELFEKVEKDTVKREGEVQRLNTEFLE